MMELERILVPVDFSECSGAALDDALFLARSFGATIDVLHVAHSPFHVVLPDPTLAFVGAAPDALEEHARTLGAGAMERFLSEWAEEVNARGVRVRSRLEVGSPCDVILRLARDEAYDLIVMGTHGHSGLLHALMGSVAEKVVRRASCPVLTTRVRRFAAAAPAEDVDLALDPAGAGQRPTEAPPLR